MFYSSITSELKSYLSAPFHPTFPIPSSVLYLILNISTQYICISGVHKLSSLTSSLTLNLVLAVRKFVSLVVSILVFRNSWGVLNSLGAVGVFGGTIVYSLGNFYGQRKEKEKTEKKE